jgi:HK97 family phage prohead protease
MIKLIAGDFTVDAAIGDAPKRTISGTAVPYNVPAVVSDGTSVIFKPGSMPVEGKAPRLFMYHDASQPVGVVTERVDTEEGMMFSAKISATTLGNDALVMALDGTIDQVSVGVNPTKFSYDEEGTMIIESALWMELSLVPIGAFGDAANITKVAASIHQDEPEVVLNEEVTPVEEKSEMSEATETAVEATIPTAPIFAQAKRQFDLPTPGEYLAAMHIGGETFRNVAAAAHVEQHRLPLDVLLPVLVVVVVVATATSTASAMLGGLLGEKSEALFGDLARLVPLQLLRAHARRRRGARAERFPAFALLVQHLEALEVGEEAT